MPKLKDGKGKVLHLFSQNMEALEKSTLGKE